MDEPIMTQGVATFIWIVGSLVGFIAAMSVIDVIKTNKKEDSGESH
ncbi:MAG: hypothetical protein AAF363_04350 [Bacteroidota bacterium]